MIRRISPFLLALMCVATMIGPAVADTPTVPPAAVNPTIYDEIRAGRPGSLEKWQLEQMKYMLSSGLYAYQTQTGAWPTTLEAVAEAGMLSFRPQLAAGQEYAIVSLDAAQVPPANAIGIRLRPTDCRLIRLGADGDPLAPIMEEIPAYNYETWPLEYPWSARLATLLESQLVRLCVAHASLTGSLPGTPAQLLESTELMPVGMTWQSSGSDPVCGVRLEIDATGEYLRTTRFPNPGYGQVTTYGLIASSSSTVFRLERQPWLPAKQLTWQVFGTLARTVELPPALAQWSPLSPPAHPAYPPNSFHDSPNRSGIVLDDFVWYANYFARETGSLPSPEWVVSTTHPLHRLLSASGTPLPFAANDAVDLFQPQARSDRPTASGQVLIGCGLYDMGAGPQQTMVSIDMPFEPYDSAQGIKYPGGGTSGRGINVPNAQTMARRRSLPDPALTGLARSWLGDNPEHVEWEMQDWLWTEEESLARSYEHSYSIHAVKSLARTYGEWRKFETSPMRPQDWLQVLSELGLVAANYRILASDEPSAGSFATCEFALEPTGRYLQLIVTLPGGDRTRRIMQVKYDDGEYADFDNFIYPQSQPEAAALQYEHFVAFAIPIPDPPALPEATP